MRRVGKRSGFLPLPPASRILHPPAVLAPRVCGAIAALPAGFHPNLSRKPFAQTDLSLLPSKSARTDYWHITVKTGSTAKVLATRQVCQVRGTLRHGQ